MKYGPEKIVEKIVDSFKQVEYLAMYNYRDFNTMDMDDLEHIYRFYDDVKDLIYDVKRQEIKKEIKELIEEDNFESKKCKYCKYYNNGICETIWIDDKEYPHNNSVGAGIKLEANDDVGVVVNLRVDENFGCNKFKKNK